MKNRFLKNPVQFLLLAILQGYKLFFRAWIGSVCRFEPTCSSYAKDALITHGAAVGSYLTLRRLVRCQPWCNGGHDPIPDLRTSKGLFTRFSYQAAPDIADCLPLKDVAQAAVKITHFSEKIPP